LGNMKRHFTCGIVDSSDCFAYCGTKTGDVFEVCENNFRNYQSNLNR